MKISVYSCICLCFTVMASVFMFALFLGDVVYPYRCPENTYYISKSEYCLSKNMTFVKKEFIGENNYNISVALVSLGSIVLSLFIIWILGIAFCTDYYNKLFCECCYKNYCYKPNIEVKPNPNPTTVQSDTMTIV